MLSDRGRQEAGFATVWGLCWVVVCVCTTWLVLLAAMVVARQHRLDGAADLASLSGAARLQRGGDACALAERVARENHATLGRCRVERDDVVVEVRDDVELPFGFEGRLEATARAGPNCSATVSDRVVRC